MKVFFNKLIEGRELSRKKGYLCSMMYCFNPDSDLALADGRPYYRPPAEIRRMERDLCLLPAWYARPGSVVKVSEDGPSALERWDGPLVPSVSLARTWQPVPVCPWGWNPALVAQLRGAGVPETCFPSDERLRRIRELSSRCTWTGLLAALSTTEGTVGRSFACTCWEEVRHRVSVFGDSLLKAPWSGSGRGLVRVSPATWTAGVEGWAARILRTQGALMVEPIYNKVVDFAMEFMVGADGQVRFCGYSLFETDTHGNYKLNLLLSDAEIERRLSAYVSVGLLHRVREQLTEEFRKRLEATYTGYLGVDMMVCRTEEGECWLHPCVEVNLPTNMGVVARRLYDRFVLPGAEGRFVVEHYGTDGEALAFHHRQLGALPPVVHDGRMAKGYLSLTPVTESTHYQAYIVLDTDANERHPKDKLLN